MASELVEMHEQYNYQHKCESDHFAKDTIQTGEELMNAVSEERYNSWQTLNEFTYMTHSSKKAQINSMQAQHLNNLTDAKLSTFVVNLVFFGCILLILQFW